MGPCTRPRRKPTPTNTTTDRRRHSGQPDAVSPTGLNRVRRSLLARLHARSDDFAATEELQSVTAALAELGQDDDRALSRRLTESGMSFFDRMRARRRHRRHPRHAA